MQDGTGGCFPVGLNSLRLTSPCYFLVKPGILAACIAPHQYLSGAAISPPVCIHRTLRPNDSSSTCIGNGIFHPFHHHASWRTSNITSLPNQLRGSSRLSCYGWALQIRSSTPVVPLLAGADRSRGPSRGGRFPESVHCGSPA